MTKIAINGDVHNITQGQTFYRGTTGPDLWCNGQEYEVFWGVHPGRALKQRIDRCSTLIGLCVDSGPARFFQLPARRAFGRRIAGWMPPKPADWKANYGPANHWLPDAPASQDANNGFVLPANGEWHPWGEVAPDAPSGSGISHGYSNDDPAHAWAAHSGAMDRATVYYSAIDGEPLTPDQLGTRDYDGGVSDQSNGALLELAGLPRSDFLPRMYDASHFIRQCGHGIACWALSPSPLVRRQLCALAAHERLSFSEVGPLVWDASYQSMNLANLLDFVKKHPHVGIPGNIAGRTMGWRAWIMAMRIKLDGASPGDLVWGYDFLRLCALAAPAHGIIQRHHVDGVDAARHGAWNSPGMDGAQVFEWSLLACGAVALCKQLGEPVPDWVRHGIRQITGLGEPRPHWVDTAHEWPGAPLARLKPVPINSIDGPDPAAWHLDTLKALIASN